MAMRRQSVVLGMLLTPVTLFLGVFFLLPLCIIAVFSFLSPGLYGGVEWSFYHWNYGRIFGWADGIIEIYEPIYLQILFRSLSFAALTVGLTLILCYPVAFWVSRLSERWRLVFMFLITLPFFSSLIVRLYAWLLILKPSGLLNTVLLSIGAISEPLEILYTPTAVVLGMVYVMVPFMFLPLYSAVDNLDRAQIEASLDLGANRLQTFLKVVLPQTLPGIMGGAVIVFIPSVGNFVVPDVLGGAKGLMIGNLVEQQFLSSRNWPFGSALSMIIMAVVLTVLLISASRARKAGGHA
ncbi:MAG: spermidine/putrescine ABC transporter permease [Rhodobacterales bacterium RIFCSPHIGHO2_02_FULL_62_130]|jgi:spermidine/putrescine transport system permease protein|nr:MAG: spermidine/putrescine ABC transporter permease [Rhodobacterales bacterium RIFCSPHIGHO2_02_FULL_62_130]OHC58247.1 MAG: spermidine/putrescine ABC transporter permease [Rhodobacterales bacterium RIFCSPHIGHO2_12_FULL_62_75]HCY98650.1 spermidine/putrescine ABC transporter permease [Rhodobacter sp.]